MNGIALHGGLMPYGGTFLTFSDYSRNALRMAALMKRRVIHVFTHDSIGLGEDGPTHQSVEHAASLRLIPGLDVLAPVRHARNPGRLDQRDREQTPAECLAAVAPEHSVCAQTQPGRCHPQGRPGSDRQGRVCARRARRSGAEEEGPGRHHRHRFGSSAGAARAGGTRQGRHCGARRVDAVDHPVRPPEHRLQGQRAAGRCAAHRRRDGRHRRLVEVRLRGGGGHRQLRRVGAGTGAVQTFRLHRGQCRKHGARGRSAARPSCAAMRYCRQD